MSGKQNHDLEFNKFSASILLAGVIAMVSGFIADGLYTPTQPKERGFSVDVPESTGAGDAAVAEVDIGTILATADAARGEAAAMKKCTSCHSFEQGGPHKVGPNLYNTVGSKFGHAEGFAYSDAIKSHGGNWGYEELNQWLKAPAKFLKGNKMAYAGLKNDQERADVILYLKSISSSAPALPAPKPVEEPKAEEAAAKEGATTEAAAPAPAADEVKK